jgi:large subunit ribosomal protein L16
LKRGLKKLGFMWIKLFTNVPIYKKSLASRMGKGKGNLSHWIAPVKKGTILFELSGLNIKKALIILNKSKTKLPIKTKIIKNIY